MEFNPDKCEVMHFGRSNTDRKYTVNGRTLKSIDRQRDLGVQIHRSLKVAMQVEKVVKKAYGMLAFIGWGIEFKNWQVMLQLYRTLVKPHLEYSVQILVATLPEGYGGFGEGTEKIYQDLAWCGGH